MKFEIFLVEIDGFIYRLQCNQRMCKSKYTRETGKIKEELSFNTTNQKKRAVAKSKNLATKVTAWSRTRIGIKIRVRIGKHGYTCV